MAETIADTLNDPDQGGYLVEVTDDNQIRVASQKDEEGVTLTTEQAQKAIDNMDARETVPLGDGLGVHYDGFKDDWVGIGYEDMEEEETFLGIRLTNHVASVPVSALEDAIGTVENAVEA